LIRAVEPDKSQAETRVKAAMQPTPGENSTGSKRLIQLLKLALVSLAHLRERAGNIAEHENPAALGYNPRQMKALCKILDHGCGRIERRRAILEGTLHAAVEPEVDLNPTLNASASVQFMEEYRACCRLLCKALSEAQRVPNGPTAAMLSDFVLALEKQLWLIDPGSPEHRPYRLRSMSFLLTC
jgi:hypothetical protein